ncbi:MAG: IS982 family transposase [Bacteroidota bacterium]|nr:IS982 family transposase [Bacteroidota bacterium]
MNTEIFNQIRKPKLSNLEVFSVNLTAEYMNIYTECQLFMLIKGTYLEGLIERSVYNCRKRLLFGLLEQVRRKLSGAINEFEDYFVVDSMPLEICKNTKVSRSTICKEDEFSFFDKGYCASQSLYYFGYKLHGICSVNGIFQSINITPASVHDIHFMKDIQMQLSDCVIIGDKGNLSADIQLETPKRANQKSFKVQPRIFKKARKRIEPLFSQLWNQFLIRRNYDKTFKGFKPRILSKITAMTMIQFLNKFVFFRPLNNLKLYLS